MSTGEKLCWGLLRMIEINFDINLLVAALE
jgi:hypothetical protein